MQGLDMVSENLATAQQVGLDTSPVTSHIIIIIISLIVIV